MAITHYHLKLKRVSKSEQQLLSALYAYLPDTGLRERFALGLRDAIASHIGEGFSFKLETVEQRPFASFLERMPAHPLVLVIGLVPYESKIICEIDSTLAMMAVERMLGGFVESMPEPRVLSETEQGVLEYLILQTMAHIHAECGKDERVHFRFDRFAASSDQVRGLADPDAKAASLAFRVLLGRHAGFVRLIFPEPFVEEAMLGTETSQALNPAELERMFQGLAEYGFVRVPVWAEAGRTTLAPADLTQIEEGDIILFEQGDMRLAGGGEAGKVILRVGNGMHGGFDAGISLDARRVRATIEGTHKGE
ncbi:MAG: hypothetical protein WC956_06220 [bacterium]